MDLAPFSWVCTPTMGLSPSKLHLLVQDQRFGADNSRAAEADAGTRAHLGEGGEAVGGAGSVGDDGR